VKVIGIDGGATKVSAALVEKVDSKTFKIVGNTEELRYQDHESFDFEFDPCDFELQLKNPPIDQNESKQGDIYLQTILNIIDRFDGMNDTYISLAMPGVKSKDKKGITAMKNGPRLPNFCTLLQEKLGSTSKISQLESDSDMCSWGEQFSKDGAFRNIQNAYYIGGGTGIADGLKLKDRILSFDSQSNWIAKTWELKTQNGTNLETLISMPSINHADTKLLYDISIQIASLIFERVTTIYEGWQFSYGLDREIQRNHQYCGTLIDRVVIGQRLSEFLSSKQGHKYFNIICGHFHKLCSEHSAILKEHFCSNGTIKKGMLHLSKLRESPIIGLGAKGWTYVK